MADFSTDAILLRKIEYGDHDLIITFLTRDHGKLPAIAKNAKQSVRRFSGALDLFSANHIQCAYPKKNKDGLVILTQSVLDNGFANIRYNVLKTAYACYWMEILTLWLEDGKPQEALFDLLYSSLDMLDQSDVRTEVISLLFQIRFMGISGFAPNLTCCDSCGTDLDSIPRKKLRFDFKEGRIVCPGCASRASRFGTDVSKGTLKQLAWINTTEMDRAERIKFSPFAIREGEILLESFIPFHIGRDFKSLGFLRRMRQEK
ncbi:MAG: DNA repair protein RecO [Desulfobacter sp.]